ncbi:zinc-dependent alcohol dehydrogenase family protein [Salinimonas sediminis]|uniref:NAD(P)-dependent alcohol dehydrogenase n=1 Tax=Salinimonas sediminis TaxID=2303538 RepID=A0A346NPC5_9ALTE|nr:NAD(P)-dependent alcohol dehydrogenase [Salinimonas sediminis]AXR07382.1 NAD(P)-dependent alcohol dehydrogenase [Salinimonas sediminis]
MKQVTIATPEQGLEGLKVSETAPPPEPGAGEIMVNIKATSLNYHDYGVASGTMKPTPGRVVMSDGAGVVTAVGEGVCEFAKGDNVVSVFFPDWQSGPPQVGDFSRTPGDGIDGYAREYVTLPAHWFTHAPSGWSHAQSATITTAGLTAWRALVVEGNLKAGDTVLLLGTGGVSVYALQIAKAMGAKVAITSSSDAKLEKARALGADFTVNYKTDEQWGKTVAKWSGSGVDHVVEVGGPATLGQSIKACRVGGSIVLIGVLTGIGGEVPTALLMRKQIRLTGIIVGSRQDQQNFVKALETMAFEPVIDKSFELEALADAFRYEESGQHFGKIVAQY